MRMLRCTCKSYATSNPRHRALLAEREFLMFGSGAIKGNVGHLEGTSGIAGIIKTILCLEKGVIAPNTNFENMNPNINAERLRIKACS